MSKLAKLMFGAMLAANIGITATPAAAQVGGGASAPAVQSGSTQLSDGRGGDRSGRGYRNRGARQDDSGSEDRSGRGYRDNDRGRDGGADRGYRDNGSGRDGRGYRDNDRGRDGGADRGYRDNGSGHDGRGYRYNDRGRDGYGGRFGYGGRNGYGYPVPAYGHGANHIVPRGYGRGPARYAGWANAGFYAPVVALPLPAYRGWGLGYGYFGAPVVVVAAPTYGWADRRRRGR